MPLCHCGVLLLEAVTQALRALHVLVDASHDTSLFPRGERFALEAVDAVVETLLDKVGIHLEAKSVFCDQVTTAVSAYGHEFLHLLLLHAVLQLTLLGSRESGRQLAGR